MTSLTSLVISSIWDFYCDISEWHVGSACPREHLSTPSYIIVQSPTQLPTQSLEWHVWSSSRGNNCHTVHRSLSSGASVYECTMWFYIVPFFQPRPPTRFLLITAIGMCHFLPVHHFGMACLAGSKVSIQHKDTNTHWDTETQINTKKNKRIMKKREIKKSHLQREKNCY